ncbi:MAG: adenylate/guanylate cyclase domain-containing protein, partial [Fimbriimonadaceae bacterium]|nr:adenylate/guanylate cyclase domain-containing protein [Alphaproteobacteria bacterium]
MSETRVQRRLTGILMADVVGYSRLVRKDEEHALTQVKMLQNELIVPKITDGQGRVVKLMGDGILAEFGSIVEAVRVAVDIQKSLAARNRDCATEDRLDLRVGINL